MKVLKILLWLALALIVLAAAGVAVFALTFDPNKYKGELERLVKERTGRTLQLKGPLEMAFWPSLGAKVAGVTLSERQPERQFLSLDSAHASVALMPLLRGELIVDRVRVSGLKAQIVKGKDGKFNFEDLTEPQAGKPPAKPEEKKAAGGAPVKFDIAGVNVEHAAVVYQDLASGQEISISDLKLDTGRIAENAQGKLDFSATARRKAPPLEVKVALNGNYALKPDAVALDFSGRLDESNVKGKAVVARAEKGAHQFDLDIDKLNLDRYLASSEKKQETAKKEEKGAQPAKPAKEADAPVDLSGLKGLNAKGRVAIGALQVQGLKLANLKTELSAADGRAQVGPHSANLYEGSLAGTVTLDGNANRVALKETLSNVAVGPLLRDAAQQDKLEGRGNVALDVTAAGKTVNAMKSALAGNAKLNLRDGAIKGVDIGALLQKARSALGKQTEAADSKQKTDFSEMSASFAIKNGVAHNDDLDVKAPLFRIGGAGDIDIGKSTINYVAKASVVATTKGQGGRELDQLAGLTVPVKLTGPLDSMKYEVDYKAVAADLAKSKVGEKAKEAIDKNKGKVEEEVRDRLKGLLGR
ncbi:MAG: AsmA family protein [Betaproteobacteria bacterium]|nr:MAG: AsmA family protein [Betaproteobacteria bacterium]